jgi:hypothetical protein
MPTTYPALASNAFVTNGGNNAGANVLGLRFPDAAIAGPAFLEAYTTTVGPAVTPSGSNDDATFSDIASVKDSCVYGVATFSGGAGVAGWAVTPGPAAFGVDNWATGAGSVKKLYGALSNLQLSPNSYVSWSVNDIYTFNLSYRVGPNTLTTAGANTFFLGARYIYTGVVDPTAVWVGNTGTEGTPVWHAWSGNNTPAVSKKLIHANAGTNPASPVLTKPSSGKLFSGSMVILP